MPHNIERHPTRKGEYLGYAGNGQAVRVTKDSRFGWQARTTRGASVCTALTLRRMGELPSTLTNVTA